MTIITFLALSLIIRLSGLAAANLWFDEWITYSRASQPLMEYLTGPVKYGEYIGVNLWDLLLRLFVWGPDWVIRLPALACAVFSLWLAWMIMVEFQFDLQQMTMSALIMACLPGLIWMAQDARFYAAITALYMASVLCALRGRMGWLTACIILSFLIHPTGPAYTVPALGIALLARSTSWRRVAIAGGISGAAWLVYMLFITTMDTSAPFWWIGSSLTLTKFIYEYGQAVTVNVMGDVGILIAFGVSWLIFMAGLLRGVFKRRVEIPITWMIWAGPLAILIIVSLVYRNVITYRTLQPAVMGLALVAGRLLGAYRCWWVPVGILLVALLINWDPSTRSGDLQAVADHIRAEWQDGDCIDYAWQFSRPLSVLLDDLPECGTTVDGRRWIVDNGRLDCPWTLVDTSSNAWQIDPLKIYLLEAK